MLDFDNILRCHKLKVCLKRAKIKHPMHLRRHQNVLAVLIGLLCRRPLIPMPLFLGGIVFYGEK